MDWPFFSSFTSRKKTAAAIFSICVGLLPAPYWNKASSLQLQHRVHMRAAKKVYQDLVQKNQWCPKTMHAKDQSKRCTTPRILIYSHFGTSILRSTLKIIRIEKDAQNAIVLSIQMQAFLVLIFQMVHCVVCFLSSWLSNVHWYCAWPWQICEAMLGLQLGMRSICCCVQ